MFYVISFYFRKLIQTQRISLRLHTTDFDSAKDLGVKFDSKLAFLDHMNEKVNKAYSILGIIKRNFIYLDKESFVLLYKTMVRPHLEYANSVWCPYKKGDIELVEKVQKRATKLVISLKHLPYMERLKRLNLPTLKYRRLRGDMYGSL